MGSQIPQSATNNWGDIKTEEERQNQQKLFTKDPEDKGEGKHPFIPNAFTVQYKKEMENGLEKKKSFIWLARKLCVSLCKLAVGEPF